MYGTFTLSQSDKRPMYLQIMEQIKQRIVVGDWENGQPIPSIRQLAVDLQVSVITVKRAYLELEREGVIVTQHGKGSYVTAIPGSAPACANRNWNNIWSRLHASLAIGHCRPENWQNGCVKPATGWLSRIRRSYERSRYRTDWRRQEVSLLHARGYSPATSTGANHGPHRAQRRGQVHHHPHPDGPGSPGCGRRAGARPPHAGRAGRREVGHRLRLRRHAALRCHDARLAHELHPVDLSELGCLPTRRFC